ncbi:tetratricopeptide repeat protein [Proteinivorax tanatarense]|uniref:Tetratricopeptide repeat protein n=1 Tax=Proteinivorax tanatarense TaxID=1260629 RepID=A0AAU7VNV6_9FIRM
MNKNKKIYKIIGATVAAIMIAGVMAPPTIGMFSSQPQMAYKEHLDELKVALEEDPNDYTKILELASLKVDAASYYISQEDYNNAEDYLHKALSNYQTALEINDEDKINILIEKSFIYHELGEVEKSEETISNAYSLQPENPEVLHSYAIILLNMGKYESAQKHFVKLSEHEQLSEEERQTFSEYVDIIEDVLQK